VCVCVNVCVLLLQVSDALRGRREAEDRAAQLEAELHQTRITANQVIAHALGGGDDATVRQRTLANADCGGLAHLNGSSMGNSALDGLSVLAAASARSSGNGATPEPVAQLQEQLHALLSATPGSDSATALAMAAAVAAAVAAVNGGGSGAAARKVRGELVEAPEQHGAAVPGEAALQAVAAACAKQQAHAVEQGGACGTAAAATIKADGAAPDSAAAAAAASAGWNDAAVHGSGSGEGAANGLLLLQQQQRQGQLQQQQQREGDGVPTGTAARDSATGAAEDCSPVERLESGGEAAGSAGDSLQLDSPCTGCGGPDSGNADCGMPSAAAAALLAAGGLDSSSRADLTTAASMVNGMEALPVAAMETA
jgi:hypothetical protein